jgi:hypothetical protein
MYWLSYRGDPMKFPPTFVNLESGAGHAQALPDGVTVSFVKANRDRETGANYITFYPNGAADKATVRFRDVNRGSYLIETGREIGIISTKER